MLPHLGVFPVMSPSPSDTGLFPVMAPEPAGTYLSVSEADFVYSSIENDSIIHPLCDCKTDSTLTTGDRVEQENLVGAFLAQEYYFDMDCNVVRQVDNKQMDGSPWSELPFHAVIMDEQES